MASGSQNMTTYKAKQLVNTYGSDTKPVYINAGVPTILGTIGGQYNPVWVNSGVVTTITAGTTGQFYRGDKTWSNILTASPTVRVNGEGSVMVADGKHYSDNTFRIVMDLNPDSGNHGIWSSGYLNGTTFTSDGKWLLVRDKTGAVQMNGNATTATTWQTARTFTVGATDKSVNGSANISWTMNEIMGSSDSTKFYRGDKTWSNTLTGDLTVRGTIYFSYNTSVAAGKPIFSYDTNNTAFGLWYYESNPDVLTFSASGNANNKTNADLSINGLGDGILSNRGKRIPHTGNTTGSVGGTTNPVYIDSGQIKAISAGQTYQFYRGDKVWSDTLVGQAPYLTVKTNDAAYYAVFRLATPANGEAAILFINGASRSGDGGANTLTLRNNVGNLRLNNNTYNTGTFTVGDAIQTSYKCQVSGTMYASTSVFTPKVMLMRSNGTSNGRLSFFADSYHTWMTYMSPSGSGNACSGGSAPSYGDVSSWAMRFNTENASGYGWIWESSVESANANPAAMMALRADTGALRVRGLVYAKSFLYDWVSNSNQPMLVLRDAENYGIRYQEGDVDKIMISATGNANSISADLCINGNGDGTVSIRGNTIIHAGNWTSYCNFRGTTFWSGWASGGEHNANSMTYNGCFYYTSNGPSGLGEQSTDGALWAQAYSSDWVTQMACDYRTGKVYVRAKKGGTWQSWLKTWYKGESITNAVWNDLAECRKSDLREPGYAITPAGQRTTKRLEPGCRITSDTWGFALGNEEDKDKMPVAISGRVLAYPARSREEYHLGDCVCSAPDGKVDIMTRQEIRDWPDCIIGIVNEIPDYKEWGPDQVDYDGRDKIKVNGRIWIDIK